MNKGSGIRAFSSWVYLLGRIETFILIFAPLLLRDTLSHALCFAFCGLFALVWIYYMLSTDAVIFIDGDGISCRRLFRRTVRLGWSDVVCSGSFKKLIYGKELEFKYFSSRHFKPEELGGKTTLPKLSESLIFAVCTPELDTLIKKYSSKSAGKRTAAGVMPEADAPKGRLITLVAADIILLCAGMASAFLRNVLPRLWLPLLAVFCTAAAALSVIIVYKKSKNK